MECRTIQEYFSAYLDRELPEGTAWQVSRHLEVCASCRREYQIWQELWKALAAEPAPVPAEFSTRVLARLPRRNPYWWRHLALAASMLLGIFLGGRLGLEMHYQLALPQNETAPLAWEGLAEAPTNSLDGLLASHDLENSGL